MIHARNKNMLILDSSIIHLATPAYAGKVGFDTLLVLFST